MKSAGKRKGQTVRAVRQALRTYADPKKAEILQKFFKTGKGDYAEGDRFIGVVVPHIRKIVNQFETLSLEKVLLLLASKIHEERLLALLILVRQYQGGPASTQKHIVNAYLANLKFVNNWDLVDSSAPHILGAYLFGEKRGTLYRLSSSPRLWDRRVAVLATFHFIKQGDYMDTLTLARRLLQDQEDLIQKAVGWMLREVGKQDERVLEKFLKIHASQMPRTMLRYAVERLPDSRRRFYVKGTR